MLKELLEHVARSLVTCPDKVSVEEEVEGTSVILRLSVDSDDMGKVIGKQGRTAKAIRTLIKAVATRENVKAAVEII
ncbi:MAG: KH domain-containing protein [Acidaminococcales bacterium]|nr:KH domain-containing protein [Acidaminococcales bacterium]